MKLTKVMLLVLGLTGTMAVAANQQLTAFSPRIVGGVPANVGEFPFIVSLQENGFGHFCGGSLIKKHWVLTAGHCYSSEGRIDKVIVGLLQQNDTSRADTFKVKRAIHHPKFNPSTMDYNFTLLELDGDSHFEPVALNRAVINIPDGSHMVSTTAGWGVTSEGSSRIPNQLMKVDVPLVPNDVCAASYPSKTTDRMVCAGEAAGGHDSCQGDSGGPLLVVQNGQPTLAGVVSWGEGCARPNRYGVYANVATVIDWIDQTTAGSN